MLHRNLGFCMIVAPILAAVASILISTTAGVRIGGEVEKYQEQEKEKVKDGGTEL